MEEANNLVPVSDEKFEQADDLLASLSNIAYSTAPKPKKEEPKTQRRSRFFFKLSRSFAEEAEKGRKAFAPKPREHVDAEVEKRLKTYRRQVPAELADNIQAVREFFLREIAPVTMAASAGSTQALEVVRRLVNSDVDGTQFDKFERMMAHAVDIKMARFVCRQLGMTKKEAEEILQAMKPRTPQIVPIGVQNGNQTRQADTKNPNAS